MAKKKRLSPGVEKTGLPKEEELQTSAAGGFLSGRYAKWAFFAVYFLLTLFLFRDFIFSDQMLFGSDTIPDGVYTRQFLKDYHHEFGGIPRWNPFILGGLPFIDAMHGDTFYPGAWIQFTMPIFRALGHKLVWHVFLAGVLMYFFLRTLRIRREVSFLGGLMYMLAPSFVSLVFPGHDAKMYVIALLPLAFAFLESGMNTPRLYKFAGLGGVMGLLILTSHIQMSYYAFWALGLYFLFRLYEMRKEGMPALAARTGLFTGAVLLAVALGFVQLFPSYKFTTSQSVRSGAERTSYEYATSWSMHPEEAAGMLVPSFQGFQAGLDKNLYWGKNPFKLNSEYNGILPILFAVLVLIARRNSRTWFFLGLGALALIYALGAATPLYHLFYSFVPGVKNFRAPGMIIFLFCFSLVVMSAHYLSALIDGKTGGKGLPGKGLLYAAGGLFFAALIMSIMGKSLFNLWTSVFYSDLPSNRAEAMALNVPYFMRDLWRVTLLAGASLVGLWMFLSKKIGVPAFIVLLALVTIFDEALVSGRYIAVTDPQTNPELAPSQTVMDVKKLMENNPPFRVLGMFSGKRSKNYYAMFGIQAADGFHNNELKTYELFSGGGMFTNYHERWLDGGKFTPEEIPRNNFLKVAGVKYILLPMKEGEASPVENFGALDRAFIVHNFTLAKDDTSAVSMLKTGFDAGKTAILNEAPEIEIFPPADTSRVSRVENMVYTTKGMTVKADFAAPGLLVVSDNWVPWWNAILDGKPVKIHRAYVTFMAVACPAGRHEITFTFLSAPYETAKKVTFVSLAFIVLVLCSSGVVGYLKRKKMVR
ncbi:MAG: hypothetical protein Q8O92_14595 [Candidatus Latescibacter sp.]|nr:hypothetical protein [Candidatus Latescibacter sp.]